jgi:hypothetical protein
MFSVTHSELLLREHCTSQHFKFKTNNCSSIYQRYQPLYLPNIIFLALCFELFLNLRGKIEKILDYTRFISHFVALVCFIALVAALFVLLKTRATKWCLIKLVPIINYYFLICCFNKAVNAFALNALISYYE